MKRKVLTFFIMMLLMVLELCLFFYGVFYIPLLIGVWWIAAPYCIVALVLWILYSNRLFAWLLKKLMPYMDMKFAQFIATGVR